MITGLPLAYHLRLQKDLSLKNSACIYRSFIKINSYIHVAQLQQAYYGTQLQPKQR